MLLASVVFLQRDSKVAQSLNVLLAQSLCSVYPARSMDELRSNIPRHRAQAAILDLEAVSLADVEELSHEFPGVRLVCNHRLADERMWAAVLNAGGADCLASLDTRGLVSAALAGSGSAQTAAA